MTCSVLWTCLIYGAIVRSKLVYGMATMAVTQAQMSRGDAFLLWGLRDKAKLQHTCC